MDLRKTDSRLAARCAAIASLGAAVIHFAVIPVHWREWALSGIFFAALATFQLVWAVTAWWRHGAMVFAVGIAANAGAAALWVTSCISGPPIGPSAGQPESVGAAGIAVLLLQCYVVMGAAWAWSHKYQPEEVSGVGRALVMMGANTVMAGAVGVGLVASLQSHHHHHGGAAEAQSGHHEEQGLPVTDMSAVIPPVFPPAHQAKQPAPAATPLPAVIPAPAHVDGHEHHHDE